MPVRPVGPTWRSVSGLLPTQKRPGGTAGMVAYATPLERDLYTCLEFHPAVVAYEEQPVAIPYPDRPRTLRRATAAAYVPDVLITLRWRSGTAALPSGATADDRDSVMVLAEVAFADTLRRNVREARGWARAGARYARERGWRFRVLTERAIRSPYQRNAAFLLPFRLQRRDAALEGTLLALLDRGHRERRDRAERHGAAPSATAGELLDRAHAVGLDRMLALPALWALVADFQVAVDLTRPLSLDARLFPPCPGPEGGAPDGRPAARHSPWLSTRGALCGGLPPASPSLVAPRLLARP